MALADIPPAPAHNALGLPRRPHPKTLILTGCSLQAHRLARDLADAHDFMVIPPTGGSYGHRFDRILITPEYREIEDDRMKEWFRDFLITRLSPNGKIINL